MMVLGQSVSNVRWSRLRFAGLSKDSRRTYMWLSARTGWLGDWWTWSPRAIPASARTGCRFLNLRVNSNCLAAHSRHIHGLHGAAVYMHTSPRRSGPQLSRCVMVPLRRPTDDPWHWSRPLLQSPSDSKAHLEMFVTTCCATFPGHLSFQHQHQLSCSFSSCHSRECKTISSAA